MRDASDMLAYFDGMLRYFEFSGRSTRRQYWLFWLVVVVLTTAAIAADYLLYGIVPTGKYPGPFAAFAGIVHLIPGITVTVRRLHDIGRSGWWYWIQLVPLVGTIVLIFWTLCPPSAWDNPYGPDPRDDDRGMPAFAASPRSTIPRQIRMGNATPQRPAHMAVQGDVQRFI